MNSSWTVMMNCSWTFVLEQFMNCNDELFINFCSWTRKFNFLRTVCELFMNYFWVHNKFLNSSWTDDELFMNVYLCELFMNYWWIVHELFFFITSSWTVHELWWWTVHELKFMNQQCEYFMNFSWTVHERSWMFMNSS